jgi:hypothetical protein
MTRGTLNYRETYHLAGPWVQGNSLGFNDIPADEQINLKTAAHITVGGYILSS